MLSVYTTIKKKIEQKASISIILYSSKSSTCHREMDGNSLASMNVDGVMRAHRMYVHIYACPCLYGCMCVCCVCTERSTEWASEWVSEFTNASLNNWQNKQQVHKNWILLMQTEFDIFPHSNYAIRKQRILQAKRRRLKENSFGKSGIFNTRAWNMNVFIYLFKSIVDNRGLSQTTNSI